MATETLSLNVRELLDNVYEELVSDQDTRKVDFSDRWALSVIASDIDHHRSKYGYMGYKEVSLYDLEDKTWVVGRGRKTGSYPGDSYSGDIIVFPFQLEDKSPEEIEEEIREAIHRGNHFRHSVIVGRTSGVLATPKRGRFGPRMSEMLERELENYLVQEPEFDQTKILASTLQHPTTKTTLYKPEFASLIADTTRFLMG